MGRRYAGYQVKEAHYDTVGIALLWTLENGLGASFTHEVKEAWGAAYGTLAMAMKEAARAPFLAPRVNDASAIRP
jgi:hemoglobin-like flavoprotein